MLIVRRQNRFHIPECMRGGILGMHHWYQVQFLCHRSTLIIRNIIAVLVGWVVGSMANMAIFKLNETIYPMPEGVDFSDTEGFAAYVSTLPLIALLLVLTAHLGQSFFGSWVAAAISKKQPMIVAMIVGVLSLIGGIVMFVRIPHPTWMLIEMPLYLVVAWLAALIVIKRRNKTLE